jgi:hypothetical protein
LQPARTLFCSRAFGGQWGLALATFYFVFISQRYAGKVSVRRDNQGFY